MAVRRAFMFLTTAACTALLATTAVAGPAPPAPDRHEDRHEKGQQERGSGRLQARHSLRAPVTDERFYFVMADRFANGDTTNDTGGIAGGPLEHGFDPTHRGFYNGGDLAGLLDQLDYIEGLGTTSIWLTPSFKNKAVQLEDGPSAGYHGYWITDFTQIDPHLGTNAELRTLVDAAHARGMKVYFDIITNHTADVIGYEEGARTAYVPKDTEPYRTSAGTPFDDRDHAGTRWFPTLSPTTSFPYTPVLDAGEEELKVPDWLNDVTLYHNRGNTTFTGEDSYYGDFFGLDDLFTEHPQVVDGMIEIYQTWIGELGIDGFRIDTMKHVDAAFWQRFGPEVLAYAKSQGKREFFMFGEVYDTTKSFTSQYTTRNRMQSVIDFPFQDAARKFASQSADNTQLEAFFETDDWYTDRNSNVYQLPTFLGNHDMGRIGYFVTTDNPGASDDELLARDRLAHELMYFSRGNPVVYYGDEQGFTGSGGDQVARQTMFASQVPEYLDDDLLGTASTHAVDNFVTSHPLYQSISGLAEVTTDHPALRDGAHQHRYASDGPGIYAFSRLLRTRQHEYVVALNNSEATQVARVPTYVKSDGFVKVYGPGPADLTSGSDRTLPVTVPALSTVVYRSVARIPRSTKAPKVSLYRPQVSAESGSRMHVSADVGGSSFNEVTFYARSDGRWRSIGTDDTAPYQVFHDISGLRTGTRVAYRAVVGDNGGHQRASQVRTTTVPAPRLTWVSPAPGADDAVRVVPVLLQVTADPERSTHVVRFERRVGDGSWTPLGSDRSSPVYTANDDVSGLPLGTTVAYRATLREPGGKRTTSAVRVLTVSPPTPLVSSVTVAGSVQSEAGCPGDWDPACATTHLAFDPTDGVWRGTFALPAGSYEWKVAIDDSWTVNYGAGGAAGGGNIALTVPAGGANVTFEWNQYTKVPTHTVGP